MDTSLDNMAKLMDRISRLESALDEIEEMLQDLTLTWSVGTLAKVHEIVRKALEEK
jgi:hypothetical protein